MDNLLNDEAALGKTLAEQLAGHLLRVGADKLAIPVEAEGISFTVRVEVGALDEVVPFHDMNPAEVERLACLAEESAEVVLEAMKVLRHGKSSWHPADSNCTPNIVRLANELGNLDYVRSKMVLAQDITMFALNKGVDAKAINWPVYTHHQPESNKGE